MRFDLFQIVLFFHTCVPSLSRCCGDMPSRLSSQNASDDDESYIPSRRLHGLPMPADEYYSDDEEEVGAVRHPPSSLGDPRPAGQQTPWGEQRKLGGPRMDEPLSWSVLWRLLVYVAAFSLCLAYCEVLTMWVSKRVPWATHPWFVLAVAWAVARCLSILALPYCLLSGYGLLRFPAVWKELIPPRRKLVHEVNNTRIFFRHTVCRDDPQQLAQACLAHTVSLLQRTLPEALYRVELLYDFDLAWELPPGVRRLRVPGDYTTPGGSAGITRMLHFASLNSTAGLEDWVAHVATGTVLRERTVDAVLAHVVDEAYRLSAIRAENDSHLALRLRIAQGHIAMGRTGGSWLAFLASTRRAGDAVAMGRCQLESYEAWIGVDPSFLLVPNELEKNVGFDHGLRYPSAELTTFALRCRDRGAQFSWLDAAVEVPAAESLSQHLQWRRESLLARLGALRDHNEGMPGALTLDRRAALLAMCVGSSCSDLCLMVTGCSLWVLHSATVSELFVNFLISMCSGTVLFCYVLGFVASCSPLSFGGGLAGRATFYMLLLVQVLWAPVAAIIDTIAGVQACIAHFTS